MKQADITKMSREELQSALKELRLYRDLTNELWERGKDLYDRIQNGKHSYQVEYFSAVNPELAWESASEIFSKVFKVNPKKEEVELLKNDHLKWWIKVYLDDEVVDLSFDKVEKALKNA